MTKLPVVLAAVLLAPVSAWANRAIPVVPMRLPSIGNIVPVSLPGMRGTPTRISLPSPYRLPALPVSLPGIGVRGPLYFASAARQDAAAPPAPAPAQVPAPAPKTAKVAVKELKALAPGDGKPVDLSRVRVIFDGEKIIVGGRVDTPESELERDIGIVYEN